jgi:subtilisin family serine protease/subtilisin-like proprotein convertase family protein
MFRKLRTHRWFGTFKLRNQATGQPRQRLLAERLEDRLAPAIADFGALVADPSTYAPHDILVQMPAEIADPAQLRLFDGVASASPLPLVPGWWDVHLADGVSVASALAALHSNSVVLSAVPNYQLHILQTPNDPQFSSQWDWNNTGQTGGTVDADIDAPEAWDIATGSVSTLVAVIDTGVDYTHPDLAANMWTNPGEIPGDGIDNDGNGFIDDIHGYDFANNDGNPMDDHGHGTHVAGTIGAVGNNGIGVTGVNWNVRIIAVKFLDSSGNGTTADAIRALNYAVQMGAQVSNNSYGGSTAEDADPLFEQAIRNAANYGHIFVAGAGNSTSNNDVEPFYPASFDADNIVAVAATDNNDQLASFSNYGVGSVDLAAPGVDILSTQPGGQYGLLSGTSMASPHVAGVIALVRSVHPEWNYHQTIDSVLNSVDYLPALEGRTITGGRLNAARALLDTDGPRVVATDPAGGVGGVVSKLRLLFNERIDPASVTVADITSFTGPNGAIAVTSVTVVPGSFDRKFDVAFAPQVAHGSYEMVLGPAITDRVGNPMDQDADDILGEPTQDQFTASFLIGDQYIFQSTDTPISLGAFATTPSYLTVDQDLSIADLNVRINISSLDVGLVGVTLVSPSGISIALAPLTGNAVGSEYQDTILDDEASTPIGAGASPFTGSYVPFDPLSAVDNLSALGTWRLEVLSLFGGTINSWALLIVANPPRLSIGDVALAEGNSGTTQATFTVRLSNAIDRPVTVHYATADGTATAGNDYDAPSGTVTFNPGDVSKTVSVAVRGDTVDEPDETFFVNLSDADNATIADGQGVGTILNDELSVAIGDASVIEGNSGNVNATFAVSLSGPANHNVAVQYVTAAGTATAGTDYVTTSGTLTFAPGETAKNVVVSVRGDTRYERGETFFVNLTAGGAFVGDGQGLGTIQNDDPVPVMTVNDVSLTEGDAGTKNLTFTIALANGSDDTITVNYATADGTASAGSDYAAIIGTLTFTPGQTSRTVAVVINGDTTAEPSETFFLNLSNPVNARLMDGQGVGMILTDDVGLTIGDVVITEGNEGAATASFTVSMSRAVPFEVQVSYATANGTATVAADYVAAGGTLTFAPGETTKTVAVLVIADSRNETDETFLVNLSGAINAAIADSQGKATILDDDPMPSISISDAAVVEGNSGQKNLTFTATLSAPSGQTVTVLYGTSDDTATAGNDYQFAAVVLTFSAGTTSRSFNVVINGDATAEGNESFFVNLSVATNAVVSDAQAIGTISDDDSLVVDDVAAAEGDDGVSELLFRVRMLSPRSDIVTVSYASSNGTAIAGSDYLPAVGTLTFQPGETLKTVPVFVIGDTPREADETFSLILSNAVGAGISDGTGVGTLLNDDSIPILSVGDVIVVEGNSGTRNAVFTLTLSQPSGQSVSVQYATADGTALAGTDYQPRSGTVNIGVGGTSTTVSVPLVVDAVAEANENFYLNLSGVMNGILADNQASASIIDDDPLPALAISDVTTTEGNTGVKTFNFSVTLSAASTQTVTVQATTVDGTATAGTDYVAASTLLTFATGQTSKTVSVTVNGDSAIEPTETFSVELSAPTNAVLADAEGLGTIQNDDSNFAIDDLTVAEGNDGTTLAIFTVSLSGPLTTDAATVRYATANGTASAGSDYVAASGTLTFAPGNTAQTVSIVVIGDTINENNETFFVNLSSAVNAGIADSQGVATIVDASDPLPSMSIDDPVLVEGASGTKNLNFTVRLSAPSGKTVTVNYATADGSAAAGSDYTAKSGSLSFGPGTTSQTITIVVSGDTSPEIDETLFVNLSGLVNATLADGQGMGTIRDDDSLVIDDVTVADGDVGTALAHFTVRLLAARTDPVTVDYATANGTASVAVDYLGGAGRLTFAPGETVKNIDVVVVGDRLDEINETLYVNLTNATGAILADSQGMGTIADDDVTPSLSLTDNIVIAEGTTGTKTVTFNVRLSAPSGQSVTVQYATADGTASAGTDYVARTGVLTISAGQTVGTITVTVNGDMLVEGNETFFLNLSNPVNAILEAAQGVATIFNDDGTLSGQGFTSFSAAASPQPNSANTGRPGYWELFGRGMIDLESFLETTPRQRRGGCIR